MSQSHAMRQLRHDVDDVYELMAATQNSVRAIASTQQRHSGRLEEIQQVLDQHSTRFDQHDARFDGIDSRLDQHDARFDAVDARLGAIEETQQEVLQLLRARPAG